MSSDPEKNRATGAAVCDPLPADICACPTPDKEPADRADEPHANDNQSTSSDDKSAHGQDGTKMEKIQSETPSRAEGLSKARIVVIMLSLCIALFLAALDMTIVTTALPDIAAHLNASTSQYTWVGSAYLLANAASVPLWGKLSDIWGRKPVILVANVIFFVGSLLCGVATSIEMLLGARVVQGVGGGGLIILVNIVISDLFSMRDRAKYFGFVGMVWAVASALGPILGGIFTEKVSWRWCFYINLPLDGFAFFMLFFFLNLHTPRTPFLAGIKAIDWVGVIAIVAGVVMFLLGLESGGSTHPWSSPFTLCLLIFGILTLVLFFVNEWKFAKYPIMPLRLFNNRSACAAFASCFLHGFVFIAGTYFLPLYFQTVLSAEPLMSGVYLLPFVLVLSIQSALVGIFIKKTGRYREPIWFGFAFMTLGFGLFVDLPSSANWTKIVIYQIIAGIGVGPNFQSPLIALQSTIHPRDIATATGTFGFIRQLSTSLSVVVGGVIFTNVLSQQIQASSNNPSTRLPQETLSKLSAAASGSNTNYLRSLPEDQKAIVNDLYTYSLSRMWIVYAVLSGFAILVSLFIGKKVLSKTHEQTKTGLTEMEQGRREMKEQKERRKTEGKAGKMAGMDQEGEK